MCNSWVVFGTLFMDASTCRMQKSSMKYAYTWEGCLKDICAVQRTDAADTLWAVDGAFPRACMKKTEQLVRY